MLNASSGVVIICKYMGDKLLRVIPVSRIQAVVGMIPYSGRQHNNVPQEVSDKSFFVVERLGLIGSDLQDFDSRDIDDE